MKLYIIELFCCDNKNFSKKLNFESIKNLYFWLADNFYGSNKVELLV